MSITSDEVRKLASLSRINLKDEEIESLRNEIDSILGYVEQINTVSAGSDAEDLSEHRNVWREDSGTNTPGEYTEKLLSNAPDREDGYLKVKKIL